MRRSKTYISIPPGVTIKEQLIDRGINQKEFAFRMGMSEKHISKLINGDVQLTTDMAIKLEMVLGIPANFWNNLEFIYREKLAKIEIENNMSSEIELIKKLPCKEMIKNGWIKDSDSVEEMVINLRKFFEITNLSLLHTCVIPKIICRRQMITEKADYALIAWAQKARLESREILTNPINIKELNKIIPIIRSMTKEEPEVFSDNLRALLSNVGIALVFLPHIGGSFLHGATFYDNNKIVIGLTVRGKDADKFWFSLFHEIGHIILGHINHIDDINDEIELYADNYASEVLIPKEDYDLFTKKSIFTRNSITTFANEIGIDVGIVVGRLQKDKFIKYEWFNDLKKKYIIM